jgi:cytochrome c oxidase assembly protein subunit 11
MRNLPSAQPKIKKHLKIMGIIVVSMFGFCYALVPIYNVFCDVTGLNGKTAGAESTQAIKNMAIDQSRIITVDMLTTLNENIPTTFIAEHKSVSLHPGELAKTTFTVKNLTNKPIVVQAIPSVSPGLAAQHIKKIECFCFQRQPLAPHEEKIMPLVFTVDPILPHKFGSLTLSYTLFDITERAGGS